MLWIAGLIVVGKGIAAVREIIIASEFGVSGTTDLFFLLLSIVNWPISVWIVSLTTVGVPLFVRLAKESVQQRDQFLFEISLVSAMLGAALAIVYLIATPWITLNLVDERQVSAMTLPLALVIPVGLVGGAVAVRLLAQERRIVTVVEAMPALAVVLALLAAGGVGALTYGTLVGFAAQATILAICAWRDGSSFNVRGAFRSPHWVPFRKAMLPVLGVQLIVGITSLADQVMVAGLGVGSIAALGYATRVLALVLGVTATAAARASLPVFSDLADDSGKLRSAASFWATTLFGLGIIVVAAGWLLAPTAIRILFERGAFGPAETVAVSELVRLGLLQVPFYLSSVVAVQALAAQGKYNRISQVGLINTGVKLAATYLLIQYVGVGGAMLGTALMYATTLLLAWKFAFESRRA